MSLKKFGNYLNETVGEFTGAADVERAQQAAARGVEQATQQGVSGLRQGFAGAEERLNPFLMGGVQAQRQLQDELFGTPTETSAIPGYESMVRARGEGLEDLATGKAGLGMLFSGRTGEEAADLSGGMEQQLREMFMGRLGQQAGMGANVGQYLGSQEMGMEGNIANMLMGGAQGAGAQRVAGAQTGANAMGDLIGAGAGLAGYMMGGPVGGGLMSKFKGMLGGGGGGDTGFSYNPGPLLSQGGGGSSFSMGLGG